MTQSEKLLFNFLEKRGYQVKKSYFQNTGYELGWEVSSSLFKMVLKIDGETLFICNIESNKHQVGLESFVSALINLWKTIIADINGITEVCGIIGNYGNSHERKSREKMKALLIANGGKEKIIFNETWVKYS
ncbi:hypothetical protein [Providencia sp. Me31A]|uniref:hypothetical protein n=1 Tax=Providencia sp. Me31A TaxID=3392637 RepID=UPI003D2B2C65